MRGSFLRHGVVYYAAQGGSNLLCLWMKSYSVTVEMKANGLCVPVVLFALLNKLIPTFESVDEILK